MHHGGRQADCLDMLKVLLLGGSETSLLVFLGLLCISVASGPVDILKLDFVVGCLHHLVR